METIKQLRTRDVTESVILECYSNYRKYYETKYKDQISRSKCITVGLCIVNQIVVKSLCRYSIQIDDDLFSDLLSDGDLIFIESIDAKLFDLPQALYEYLRLRVGGATFNKLRELALIKTIDVVEFRSAQEEDWSNRGTTNEMLFSKNYGFEEVDYNVLVDSYLKNTYKLLIRRFTIKEQAALMLILGSILDETIKCNDFIITFKFGISTKRSAFLLDYSNFLVRTIFVAYEKSLRIRKLVPMKKFTTGIASEPQKFYALLVLLDKYPYLAELYTIFGDHMISMLAMLNGRIISLPTNEELQAVVRKVNMFAEVETDKSEENIKRLASSYIISEQEVRGTHDYVKDKLENFFTAAPIVDVKDEANE